ncbi:MAG: hypothetical protein IPI49_25275 [Myxococcales bacterium]|nr:hypothetical protein [Myxococcales bacterium]
MASTRGQAQVAFLSSVKASGGKIAGARFSLQRGPLKFIEPTYWLTLDQAGGRSLQELPWTSELEEYLLFQLGLKMDAEDDESQRFAAILLNNLRKAESIHGKDYARAVLVEVLRAKPGYDLADLLDRAATPRPSSGSEHYRDCRTFLEHSVDGLRDSAQLNLEYGPDEASRLMEAALRITLDEAFHISTADLLFPRQDARG